jgi:GTP-binding protein
MTGASPLIAPYPFTTKVPHLGVIKDEASLFIFAEIPGIIKDAHKGAGLGTRFLRHTKRTRLLLHVLDITSEDPLRDYLSVKEEMRLFDEELSRKPEIVVVNKMDAPDASQKYKVIRRKLLCHNKNVLPISALKKRGIKRIISLVQKLLPQKEVERKEQIVKHYKYRPLFQIKKEGDVFIIKGEGIERIVDMFDFSESSLPFWHRWVKRMGIDEALRKAGARNGDRVRIKDKEFVYNA